MKKARWWFNRKNPNTLFNN